MARSLSWREVHRARLAAHFLIQPARREALCDVVGSVCGIHAQMMPSAELQLALRVDDLRQGDVRAALWDDRSLVKTYGLRGTLHMFPRNELAMWLAALREKPPPRPANQIEREALSARQMRQVLEAIADALDGQQLTREELEHELVQRLGAWITEPKFPAFGGQWPRWQLALSRAALEGVLVFGPNRGNRVTYVRLDQWVGKLASVDGHAALLEVARRFVHAYGPTTRAELARWLYTTPNAAEAVLHELDLEEVDVEGWQALAARGWPGDQRGRSSSAHLLPHFDCYVVGCHPRTQLIPSHAPRELQGGTAAPFAVLLVDGVVAGLWERKRSGRRLEIRVGAFDRLGARQQQAVQAQAARIGTFLGLEANIEFGAVEPRGHL